MKEKIYYIYKIINLINNKIYIGQHYGYIDDNYMGSGLLINRALLKYGKENFKKEIIEICNSKKEINNREKYWIYFYNSTNIKIGYNITKGGNGGDIYTNNPNKDKILIKFKNRIPWNKGLTKYIDKRIEKLGKKTGKSLKNKPSLNRKKVKYNDIIFNSCLECRISLKLDTKNFIN